MGRLREILDLGLAAVVLVVACMLGLSAAFGPPAAGAPVLIVAPPWAKGAAEIASVAGGSLLGPHSAAFGAIAQFDGPVPVARLRAQGAWAVRDGARLAGLCGVPP